ncbi:MAG TPA: hypothetical protein PK347_12465 [Burkholderiaceae bacterium]|nr:hypothetical protein [Burkholderiaceae bacterium]
MHIQQTAVAMQSSYLRVASTTSKERLEINGSPTRSQIARAVAAESAAQRQATSRPQPERAPPQACSCDFSPAATEAAAADGNPDIDPRMQTLARMIEAITGMRIRVLTMQDLQGSGGNAASQPSEAKPPQSSSAVPSQPPADTDADWGLVYEREVTHTEFESVSVQTSGQVKTADGRTIDFQLDLSVTSMQSTSLSESLRLGNAKLKDPLVIHFDGAVGELRNVAFEFDLDADGTTDRVPFVGTGSGFLALDANGNGQIDNGRELFGTQSGDGFADLAKLDSDGNQWIDEADPAYARLSVWRMDAAGQTSLQSLASLDVGALYLGRVASDMTLREGGAGQQLGQLRSTGLYLTHAGQAGALQQIDLVA